MKRRSNASIIPKIILILGTLSVLGIILLFFRPRSTFFKRSVAPEAPEELFTQVIAAAEPQILKLWEEGDRFIGKNGVNCPEEIHFNADVGRGYYQCQPHLWECYWNRGTMDSPAIKIELHGENYHVRARPVFEAIPIYSKNPRHYRMFKRKDAGPNLHYGHVVELEVKELPGFVQPMILTDTCRDVFLPERIYGYGEIKDKKTEGFIWDNFGKKIFIDKFYVSNQQVNEWRILTGHEEKVVTDRLKWPLPALVDLPEQRSYCSFFGKRLLEAKLFDAATMTPSDLKNPLPERVTRPASPWQRDISKTFLGTARVNDDYQLTPLDCQLAQVQGCAHKLYSTDSVSWMGMNYGMGFYPESLVNNIEPSKNLKMSSRFLPPASEWHALGKRSHWKGDQGEAPKVAFRCYEEVSP